MVTTFKTLIYFTIHQVFLAKSGAEMDEAFVERVSPFVRHFYGQPHLIVTLGGDNNFNASNDVMVEVKCVLDHHKNIVEQVESTPKYVSHFLGLNNKEFIKMFCRCNILILGLLPRPKSNHIYKQYLREVNKGLLELSQRYGSCFFAPIHKKFVVDGSVKPGLHIHDGVHLNDAGGKIAADFIFSRIVALPKIQ